MTEHFQIRPVHHPDVGGSEQVLELLERARDTLLAALR